MSSSAQVWALMMNMLSLVMSRYLPSEVKAREGVYMVSSMVAVTRGELVRASVT